MTNERVYADIWQRKLATPEGAQPVDRWVVTARAFAPAERLLDVGCGSGGATISVRNKAKRIVGTDVAVQACRAARGLGLEAVVSSLDGASLPFADGSFDAVTCLDVIEHLLDPAHVMREIARVLRPAGLGYVSTVNMRYLKFVWELAVSGRFPRTSNDAEAYDGGHLHYFTAANLQDLGRDAGLRAVRHIGVVPSSRLRWLQPLQRWWPVRDFLAAGFLIVFEKPARA
jgi:SAM-dependent methyltransferase